MKVSRWGIAMARHRDRRREPLVRVAIASNPLTAQEIQDILEKAGIRSLLKNQDSASVVFGTIASPFALEIFVLQGDADRASLLLGDPPPEPLPPASLPDKPT